MRLDQRSSGVVCGVAVVLGQAALATGQTTVFFTDFEQGIPTEMDPGAGSSPAMTAGVQGFAGLGPEGNRFAGEFLRAPTGLVVTLELEGLPEHDTMSVAFLFAAIDSLDGTGSFPQGDFFTLALDGQVIFRESFANALPSQVQSYIAPEGAELARRVDLGFSGPGSFYTDSAYNFGDDPRFALLPHTASRATLTFQMEGPGIQSLDDESWAMDNLRVTVGGSDCGRQDLAEPFGSLDIFDILAFFAAFGGGDLGRADFAPVGNPDGLLNIFDILEFFAQFGAGC